MNASLPNGLRALALLLLHLPFCHADVLQYALNFGAPTTGTATPTGTFTYNTGTSSFESFDVAISGVSFPFLTAANAPVISLPAPSCLGGGLSGGEAFFQALTAGCGSGSWQYSTLGGAGSFTFQYADAGTLTVTATAILPSNLSGGGGGGGGGNPPPGDEPPPPPPPDRPIVVAAGQIGIATQVNAEVPEPALALPVALVLGVLLSRRKGQRLVAYSGESGPASFPQEENTR